MMKIPWFSKSWTPNNKLEDLEKKKEITKERFLEFINTVYDKALAWDPKLRFIPAEDLAKKFLEKNIKLLDSPEYKKKTCENLIINQTKKTSTTGFISSVWWIITMPITLPTDMYITLLVEIRMILAIAYIWWYDLNVEQLRTYVFMILSWKETKDIFIRMWLKPLWKNITYRLIQRVPQKMLAELNKKIWIIMFSKFSTKWALHLWLAVPLVWWLIGGGINFYFTKRRWKNAIQSFIEDASIDELMEWKD